METIDLTVETLEFFITYGSIALLSAFVSYLIIRSAVCSGIKDSKK